MFVSPRRTAINTHNILGEKMIKMRTLFLKDWENNGGRVTAQKDDEIWEWVKDSIPYIKRDGTSVMIKDGVPHYRYELRRGKEDNLESDFIKCDLSNESIYTTYWIPLDENCENYNKRIMVGKNRELVDIVKSGNYSDGTYEFCGNNISGNHEKIDGYKLFKHDSEAITDKLKYDFDWLRNYVCKMGHEGIVFHHPTDETKKAKLRQKDFGKIWHKSEQFGNKLVFYDRKHFQTIFDECQSNKNNIISSHKVDIMDFIDVKKTLDKNNVNYHYRMFDHERNEYIKLSKTRKRLMFELSNGTIVSSKFVNLQKLEIDLVSDDNGFVDKLFTPIYWEE